MTDTWSHLPDAEYGPSANAAAVTPSDTVDLGFITTQIIASGAGVISCNMQGTGTAVLIPVAAGVPLPIRVRRVLATGTTATGIVALW
ncbi:hypothetical protein EBZ38_12480 [bacterium]|nr:hypothetical protein [bacterium]NDC95359.1 hypothetical protein [bacterium]NDD85072.1 hypothetical protein [bacterium]NDG19175.1 hypothetical protein [Betaproteobacteria bacterium]